MTKTYYIFRHGLTNALKTATAYGDTILTAPIVKDGEEAIEKIGEYLKDKETDFNVSSPIIRCKQTSGIVSKIIGKKFIFDDRLTEYNLESQASLEERLKSLLSKIEEKGYEKIAICTHGAVISVLIAQIASTQSSTKYDIYNYPDPGVLVIIQDKNLQEINFN